MKYGQEDILNLWQMGRQNLKRLLVLSFSIGGLATMLWWKWHAPSYSFYYLFQYCYSWLYCRIPFGCSAVATHNLQVLQPFMGQLGELVRGCGTVFALTSFVSGLALRFFLFGTVPIWKRYALSEEQGF
jgi:hypothetical protein